MVQKSIDFVTAFGEVIETASSGPEIFDREKLESVIGMKIAKYIPALFFPVRVGREMVFEIIARDIRDLANPKRPHKELRDYLDRLNIPGDPIGYSAVVIVGEDSKTALLLSLGGLNASRQRDRFLLKYLVVMHQYGIDKIIGNFSQRASVDRWNDCENSDFQRIVDDDIMIDRYLAEAWCDFAIGYQLTNFQMMRLRLLRGNALEFDAQQVFAEIIRNQTA